MGRRASISQARIEQEHTIWGGSFGAVGPKASGQRATAIADHGPLTEAGWTRCGWGLLSGSVAGLRACWVRPRSSPFLALKRVCTLVGICRLEVPR